MVPNILAMCWSRFLGLLVCLWCPLAASAGAPAVARLYNQNIVYSRVGTPSVTKLGVFDTEADCTAACVKLGKGGCGAYAYHLPSFPSPAFAKGCFSLVSAFDWYPTANSDVVSARLLWPCDSADGCARNGQCVDGACVCAPGWKGFACHVLDLAPVDPARLGFRSVDAAGNNVSSWGGAVLPGATPDSDSDFTMYASEIEGGCGMNAWCTNSRVVRATAVQASGPFVKQNNVFPVFSHEPSVARDPTSGRYAMYFTAEWSGKRPECSPCANGVTLGPCSGASQCSPDTDPTYLSTAPTVDGP